MAVGGDETPVEAHFPGFAGGHDIQLGGEEVLLDDAVLFVEPLHDVQLYQIAALTLNGFGAQDHIQLLTADDLAGGLFHLACCQVGQQIGDHQHGIVLVFAYGDGDGRAVLADHHTVERQGQSYPLVLLHTAVVMGLEEGDLGILIQGIGLQIHPGRVHMGGADVDTLFQGLLADDGQGDGLAVVIVIDFVAGLGGHAGNEGDETLLLGFSDGPGGCLPFGLACIDKRHITLGKSVDLCPVIGRNAGKAVLGSGQ